MKSGVAFREEPSIACDVIGRTGAKLRLRARGSRDLFDDALAELELEIGCRVLVDSDEEGLAADVIGLPRVGVVEIQTRAEFFGKPKAVTIRRARIQGAKR